MSSDEVVDERTVARIEVQGVSYISEERRNTRPKDLRLVWIGAQLCVTVIIVGWLPVSFGLSWWASVAAITVGVGLGSIIYAPYALIGTRTGTNSAVSSGAFWLS